MPTRNINLTDHLDRFVERQVASGRYSNASEIVRDALRLLEEQEEERTAKLKALRKAAAHGFDQIDQGQGILLKGKKAGRADAGRRPRSRSRPVARLGSSRGRTRPAKCLGQQFVDRPLKVIPQLQRLGRVLLGQIPLYCDAGVQDVLHTSSREARTRSTATLTVPRRRRTSSVARSDRSRTRRATSGSSGVPLRAWPMTACASAS